MATSLETRRPPYSFAKRHGVLVGNEINGRIIVFQRPNVKMNAIKEIQRFLGVPIAFKPLEEEEFDELLTKVYDSGADGSLAMMEDLGDDLDLESLADSIPEPQDLMEADDEDRKSTRLNLRI